MSKRPGGEVPVPGPKRITLAMPPLDIGPACGEEDLNVKVLQVEKPSFLISAHLSYLCTQVQNKKLSERLRERNFAREQLEARLEEAEGRVEEQRRALASVPRHLQALRDHLVPLLPKSVAPGSLGRVGEESRPETCLEEGFRAALSALRLIVSSEKGEGEMMVLSQSGERREGDISSVHEERGEGEAVPHEGVEEVARLQDENRTLQSRCEDMDSALADAR